MMMAHFSNAPGTRDLLVVHDAGCGCFRYRGIAV